MSALADDRPVPMIGRNPRPEYGARAAYYLDALCTASGLSGQEIGRRAGMVGNSTIWRLRHGERRASRAVLIRILKVVGATDEQRDELLALAGMAPVWATSPYISDVVYVLRHGDPQTKRNLLAAINAAKEQTVPI